MFMNNIKLFDKNEKELETLMQAVKIYRDAIGMKFGIKKFVVLIMKSGKWHRTEGVEQPNQGKIRSFVEKETCKYLGILEADTITHAEMKEKFTKNTWKERENYSKPNYVEKNLIEGINTLIRYSGPFLKQARKLQQENSWRCIRPYIPEMT